MGDPMEADGFWDRVLGPDPAVVAAVTADLEAAGDDASVARAIADAGRRDGDEVRAPWRITGTETAEWAMRRLAEAQAEVDAAHAQAEAWRQRATEWELDVTRKARTTVEYFSAQLERWALGERERTGGKTKTVKLPSGQVSTTGATSGTVVVDDEALLLKWLDDNVDADVVGAMVKRKVGLTELRSYLTAVPPGEDETDDWRVLGPDGEVPAGVHAEPPKVTAKAKPAR